MAKIKLFNKTNPGRIHGKKGHEEMTIEEKRSFIINDDTSFNVKEAYKALRTNIIFSLPDEGSNKIIITSSLAGEGKSTTCINTAISFAETNKKVVIVDCDLRRPNIAKLLNINSKPGLSNYLVRINEMDEIIRKDVRKNMDVITSGDIPPNPSELLDSSRMGKLVETLSERYDYVFLDTPPVLAVTDTSVLTKYSSGVLLLASYGKTDKTAVSAAVEQLRLANAKILGGIFNCVETEEKGYNYKRYGRYSRYGYKRYGYGYGYGYGENTKENTENKK